MYVLLICRYCVTSPLNGDTNNVVSLFIIDAKLLSMFAFIATSMISMQIMPSTNIDAVYSILQMNLIIELF